jgi:2-oxoisovalerate dehydrogenase E1 component
MKLRSEIKLEIMRIWLCNAEPEIEAILSEELNDILKPFVLKKLNLRTKRKNKIYRCHFDSLRQSMERQLG